MATDKVPHDCVPRTSAGVAEYANNGHTYEETVSDCTVLGLSRSSGETFWPYVEIRAPYGALRLGSMMPFLTCVKVQLELCCLFGLDTLPSRLPYRMVIVL